MDLTPRLLHDVEFSQEWRGYNREEVDDFLERVAASVEQLLARLRDGAGGGAAVPASEAAPQRSSNGAAAAPAVPAPLAEDTEAITRTLVLAQRTADAAIAEAKDAAAALVADAEGRAAAVLAAAEADARRILDSGRAEAAAEAKQLEATRGLLQADVEALEQHLAEQRRAVESVVERLQSMLDDPEAMRAGERPELHVTAPIEPAVPVAPVAAAAPPAEPEPEPDVAVFVEAQEPSSDDREARDGGPPTMEVATVFIDDEPPIDLNRDSLAGSSGDDAFLTELRKAAVDEAPLGPRDDEHLMPAGHGIFDQDQLDSREGLRSRLRRRP